MDGKEIRHGSKSFCNYRAGFRPNGQKIESLKSHLRTTSTAGDSDHFSRYLENEARTFYQRLAVPPCSKENVDFRSLRRSSFPVKHLHAIFQELDCLFGTTGVGDLEFLSPLLIVRNEKRFNLIE